MERLARLSKVFQVVYLIDFQFSFHKLYDSLPSLPVQRVACSSFDFLPRFFMDALIHQAFLEGHLSDKHLAIDVTQFESRDASKPSEKKERSMKKRGRKSKEEHATWLAEQAEMEANRTTYEKKIEHQLIHHLKHFGQTRQSLHTGALRKIATVKIHFGMLL